MDTIFNRNGCFYRALDDEPVFTLLARDPCFAEVVRYWVTLRQALIGQGKKPLEDHAMLAEAVETATSGVVWRNDSTDPTKGYDAGEHARWHVETPPERELVESGRAEAMEQRLLKDAHLFLQRTQYHFDQGRESSIATGEINWTAYLDICALLGINPADKPTRRPRKPYKSGGEMLPYDDWLTVEQTAMRLGNRFLLWEIDGKLVFNENMNWRDETDKPDWTGYYEVNHSLQTDMLWNVLRDHKAAKQHKVDVIRGLVEVPAFARILRRANQLGTEGCPSELLTKYMLTFADDMPVTFFAGDIRKALEALRRERDLAPRLQPVTSTSGSGEIDPAKEALWIDMAEERGFLSAEEATARRAELPEGTKAAIPSKHLMFIVGDLGRKISCGLRQVADDIITFVGEREGERSKEVLAFADRISGYARELEEADKLKGRPFKNRIWHDTFDEPVDETVLDTLKRKTSFADASPSDILQSIAHNMNIPVEEVVKNVRDNNERIVGKHPALGAPYGESPVPEGEDPYKTAFGPVPANVYYGVEEGNFYDMFTRRGMGNDFHKTWWPRREQFPSKVHDEFIIPKDYPHPLFNVTGRWSGRKIDPSQYTEVAERFRKALEDGDYPPLKAESDTLDVTDTPDMPPHRFTMFTKSRGWAYGRGLEINPAHIPDMLDRMADDGWDLQCVLGGVEPTKVGMLFRRLPASTRERWVCAHNEELAMAKVGIRRSGGGPDMGRGLEP